MEMMEAAEFNVTIDEIFSRKLNLLGFEAIRGHKWVKSNSGEIRQLFTLGSSRGVALFPRWGFSFDFTPHIGPRERVKWHRTPKAAAYDLSYDPIDYTRNIGEWTISRYGNENEIIKNAEQIATRAVSEAEMFWGRVHSLSDVADLFEEWRHRKFVRFGFDNYVNAPLAYSFVLARLGRKTEATEWLEKFLSGVSIETGEVLREHLERTLQTSSG
jgi:hypothetical protein